MMIRSQLPADVIDILVNYNLKSTIIQYSPDFYELNRKSFDKDCWLNPLKTFDGNFILSGSDATYNSDEGWDNQFRFYKVSLNKTSCIDAEMESLQISNGNLNFSAIPVTIENPSVISAFNISLISSSIILEDTVLCTDTYTMLDERISPVKNQNKFGFYPNPTSDRVTIHADDLENQNYHIEFVSVTGLKIKQIEILPQNHQISKCIEIAEFPTGLYFINIRSASFQQCLKLIKQ